MCKHPMLTEAVTDSSEAGMSVEAMDLEGHSAAFYANEAGKTQ